MPIQTLHSFIVLTLFQVGSIAKGASGWSPVLSFQRRSFSNKDQACRHFATSSPPQVEDTPPPSNDPLESNSNIRSDSATHQITWKTACAGDIVFEAADGETVRTAALRRGLISPHNGRANLVNCRGLGSCGTCAIEIEGPIDPVERNVKEQLRLNFPPHGPSSSSTSSPLRLACQVQVRGDIQVTKRTGFWGQYKEVAAASIPTQPFDELEFLLDSKSPPTAIAPRKGDAK